jgi:hypothetical protein
MTKLGRLARISNMLPADPCETRAGDHCPTGRSCATTSDGGNNSPAERAVYGGTVIIRRRPWDLSKCPILPSMPPGTGTLNQPSSTVPNSSATSPSGMSTAAASSPNIYYAPPSPSRKSPGIRQPPHSLRPIHGSTSNQWNPSVPLGNRVGGDHKIPTLPNSNSRCHTGRRISNRRNGSQQEICPKPPGHGKPKKSPSTTSGPSSSTPTRQPKKDSPDHHRILPQIRCPAGQFSSEAPFLPAQIPPPPPEPPPSQLRPPSLSRRPKSSFLAISFVILGNITGQVPY